MSRLLRGALIGALLVPAFSVGTQMPALAKACDAANAPGGYIGQKWTAFGGAASALGCATDREHDYSSESTFGSTPARGRVQDFEHGMITWYPSMGPKMTLSTWWNGPEKMHFDFSDVTNAAGFRVDVSDLSGKTSRTFTYSGGPGHNRDIDLASGMDGSTGLWVRLYTCKNGANGLDCPPHMTTATVANANLHLESPSDAPQAVFNTLYQGQVTGSLASNAAPAATVAQLPEAIHFDTNVLRFNGGAPMDGYSHVTFHRDGRVEFESHFHDSGAVDYYYSISWAIAASDGTMFTLNHSGKCEGHIVGSGGRDDDHDVTTSPNPAIVAHWAALAKASTGKARADVNPNFGSLLDTLNADIADVKEAVQAAEAVYQTVQTVVAIAA